MAATRGMIQHRGRFAIPFRQRVGDPANVVEVTVNVQRALGSKKIADDGDFVGPHCRSSQHCANGEADNLTYLHFDSFRLAAARRNIYSARRPMLKAPIGLASGCSSLFIRSSSIY